MAGFYVLRACSEGGKFLSVMSHDWRKTKKSRNLLKVHVIGLAQNNIPHFQRTISPPLTKAVLYSDWQLVKKCSPTEALAYGLTRYSR